MLNWLIKGLTGSDSGPEVVGVASFNNPLFPVCLLFNALLSRELNLLNAGLVEMGAATCNSWEPGKKCKKKLVKNNFKRLGDISGPHYLIHFFLQICS